MVGFAQYAFNKSHATAYGIISYRTAYLKAHYPTEYFAALLTSVLDSSVKIREYIADASRHGVSVLPPDINQSGEAFTAYDGKIRYGLLAIKNVGRLFAAAVIAERERAPFKSFDDFVGRMAGSDINKRTVESMIKCGAFDSLGVTRSSLLSCYESILDGEHDRLRNNVSGQMDLFSLSAQTSATVSYTYPKIEEYTLRELLAMEKESSGMYFSGHMIDNYSKHLESLSVDRISDIVEALSDDADTDEGSKYRDRSQASIAGIISARRTTLPSRVEGISSAAAERS